ncbi:MAG: transcriptional regulator [Methanosarcinales archaeon]|nr:MAG: transcriptional regulator [Methanosarcinales archaeon]
MKFPCENVVWYVLPAIRSELSKELAKVMSQKKISEILGITQAAVSQYVSNKRGSKIEFQEDVLDAIHDLANDIAAGNLDNQTSRICEICIKARKDETLCGLNCECESGGHGH